MRSINWPTVLVSMLASLVITGGVATAANQITTRQIKNGAITYKKLSKDVQKRLDAKAKDGTNGRDGFAGRDGANGLDGVNGQNGAKGDTGAQGIQGIQGDKGDQGDAADVTRVVAEGDAVLGNGTNTREDSPGLGLQWMLANYGDNAACDGRGNEGVPETCSPNGALSFDTPQVVLPGPYGLVGLRGSKALKFANDSVGHDLTTYLPFERRKLSELTDLSYSTLVDTPGDSAGSDIVMKVEVRNAWGSKFSDGYRTVVIVRPASTQGVWQRHNLVSGQIWASSPVGNNASAECGQANYCTFNRFVELSPDAVIQSVKLVTGQNNGTGWKNFVGYVDNVTIGFGTAVNYDLGG